MAFKADIVVFSHLRWSWVYQRPQHLLSRLARGRRVFFIEEPLKSESGTPEWKCSTPEPGVTVCQPMTDVAEPGFSDTQLAAIQPMLPLLFQQHAINDYVVWMYTPMALPLARTLEPQAVVYDVMDELSAFKGAPPQLLQRESALYEWADVIFTGGPSLYRAKKDRHANVHCLPSSVDEAHFAQARTGGHDASEQSALPRPRLGFFGVIDERMDLPLLDAMARSRPQWQICMVGPVIKIDPAELPRHPNLHYFGQQSYERLPDFISGWDVCLLPFARNEATRFISPTKTLEYMASDRPIVSTPITDVAEPYGELVELGDTAEEFIAGCDRALSEKPDQAARRRQGVGHVLASTSWDATAKVMADEIAKAIETRAVFADASAAVQAPQHPRQAADQTAAAQTTPEKWPAAVIGAGPTGLSAAYHLGDKALLIERNDRVGGWCRSIVDHGFTFDFAGHIMFSNDPYVHEMYKMLLGDNVHWQDREAWIYSKNVFTRYPFQGALYGLPPKVIKECIMGALEARFGSLAKKAAAPAPSAAERKEPANPDELRDRIRNAAGKAMQQTSSYVQKLLGSGDGNGHGNGRPEGHGHAAMHCPTGTGDVKDCCADGVLESTAELSHYDSRDDDGLARRISSNSQPGSAAKPDIDGSPTQYANFEEFIYKVWGRGIAEHFAIPYNRKLWAVPLTEMETSWLGGRVPLPDLEEMIEGALSPVPKPMGPNARFGYPLRGGFQALMNGFLPHLKGGLRLNTKVVGISPSRHTVTLSDGSVIKYEKLISTMPLPTLVRMTDDEAPPRVRKAAAGLRYVSVRCVNLGVGRANMTDKHWIYYPEDTVFHRIFVQGNASPYCNAPGGTGMTCEITYSSYKPLPCDGQELIDRCIAEARRMGIIREDDPIWTINMADMPHAYVVYDHARAGNVKTIRDWLAKYDIILAGRYSEWEYYNSDHAFLAGKKAADAVLEALSVDQAEVEVPA